MVELCFENTPQMFWGGNRPIVGFVSFNSLGTKPGRKVTWCWRSNCVGQLGAKLQMCVSPVGSTHPVHRKWKPGEERRGNTSCMTARLNHVRIWFSERQRDAATSHSNWRANKKEERRSLSLSPSLSRPSSLSVSHTHTRSAAASLMILRLMRLTRRMHRSVQRGKKK